MKRIFLILIGNFFFFALSLYSQEYKSVLNKNFDLVKKLVTSYNSIDSILSDTNLVSYNYRINKNSITFQNKKLKNHILKNKFYEGFYFEKDTLMINTYLGFALKVKTMLVHKIKIRSSSTKDIIWFEFEKFVFTNYWQFRDFFYYNNLEEQIPDKDKSCDKKLFDSDFYVIQTKSYARNMR